MNKRFSGFLSWTRNRVRIHRPEVLALLIADLKAQAPDHVTVTGDLVNISLPEEFKAAADWLKALGSPDHVTIVPGNHDAYVNVPWDQATGLWAPYMQGARTPDAAVTEPLSERDFPFIRRLGPIALVGTSTAVPMPVFIAAGRLGAEQRERLSTQLQALGHEGLFRVVLIHHPPFGGGAYKRKSLLDAKEFQDILAKSGAEMVLHGHMHVSSLGRAVTPAGLVPVFGVPSASAIPHGHKDPARYHLYRIEKQADSWSLEVEIRGLNATGDGFERQGSMAFVIPLLSSGTPSSADHAAQHGTAGAAA